MTSHAELLKIAKGLQEIERRKKFSRLDFYEPYPKQTEFHAAGATFRERLLMAGNQCGKTFSGAAEFAMHLTGRYPGDWPGRKWDRPVRAWAGSDTSLTTRDVVQKMLCGEPGVADMQGTGMIPKECVDWKKDGVSLGRGITDGYDTVSVKHATGGLSILKFKSYEQGRQKWQGDTIDLGWMDEEPPMDIYSECLTRTNATGGMVFLTFTPLLGMSDVVLRFLNEISPDRHVTVMTIDDVKHFTPEQRTKIVASYQEYEREARTKGIPAMGSGRVFPFPDSLVECDDFDIPAHWSLMWAVDFGGSEHPFAAVLLAWNRDDDVIYVVHGVRLMTPRPIDHAAAMRPRGLKIPVAWPHDGESKDRNTGEPLAKLYKAHGLKMLASHAAFPDGSISTEAGIAAMYERITTARLKVFKSVTQWFEEFRLYHRKDGLIVKKRDDLMSATRIGVMQIRSAQAVNYDRVVAMGGDRVPIAQGVDFDLFTGQ